MNVKFVKRNLGTELSRTIIKKCLIRRMQISFDVPCVISLVKLIKKIDTHSLMKHFKINYSGAQPIDMFECNKFADNIMKELIKHVKKRGKCKLNK